MGELLNIIETKLKTTDISELYKENTMYFYDAYKKSSKMVLNVPISKIQLGGFYFLHYQDDSNWMKYSPVFVADFKKFDSLIIIYGINFNFIPLEIRSSIFDKFITKDDMDKNKLLAVDYEGVYKALLKMGYSYALVEYNLAQVKLVHKIDMRLIPDFLYSGHPINKYDPIALYNIHFKKLKAGESRNEEMMDIIIKDFYDINNEIDEKYELLKKHIQRVQNSYKKYG